MSETEPVPQPVLRREALLPNERNRGLGTVAVVCTMAGVASGLALATTLMAMQVADSMSTRACPYHVQQTSLIDSRADHGFLGIQYFFRDNVAVVDKVLKNTPAERSHLQPGDHIVRVNSAPITSAADLQERIFNSHPGAPATLLVEHDGSVRTVHATLMAWPALSAITY